jgi:hypothetical protein
MLFINQDRADIVYENGKNKNTNVTARGFVIKEKAYKKEKKISQEKLIVNQRKHRKDNGEKSPKVKLGEKERRIRIKRKNVGEVRKNTVNHQGSLAGRRAT